MITRPHRVVGVCAALLAASSLVSNVLQISSKLSPSTTLKVARNFGHTRRSQPVRRFYRDGMSRPALMTPMMGSSVHHDYARFLEGGLQHWSHFPISVAFAHDRNDSPGRERLAMAGFNEWVRASGGRVSYRLVSGDADVAVRFDPNMDHGVTDATFMGSTLSRVQMRIGMQNGDGELVSAPELCALSAHEFGHALGINGHSPNSGDIMHPAVSAGSRVSLSDLRTLSLGYNGALGF